MEHAEVPVDITILGASKSCRILQRTLEAIIALGLSGIPFARFYLDTHPEGQLTIFEKDECIGRVWNSGM